MKKTLQELKQDIQTATDEYNDLIEEQEQIEWEIDKAGDQCYKANEAYELELVAESDRLEKQMQESYAYYLLTCDDMDLDSSSALATYKTSKSAYEYVVDLIKKWSNDG